MKIKNKIISLVLVCAFSVFAFAGCSNERLLSKESKNLTTYFIDAVFCDEEKKLSCVEEVDYINSKDTILNSVCFNLYPSAFSEDAEVKPYAYSKQESCFPNGVNYGDIVINEVLANGQNATYGIIGVDNNALEVVLTEPLFFEERVFITIDFEVKLANCAHRLGYNDNSVNLGNWFPIVAVYEGGEFKLDPYYANGDPFYSDVANYEVSISYPDKYTLASTGNLVSTSSESGMKQDYYSAKVVRDFAMCLATNYITRSAAAGDTIITVYAYEGDVNLDSYLETSVNAVTLFNEMFGEYPYKRLDVAFTEFFQGGMEYPGLVFISDSVTEQIEIKKVIVHEIAHQWWYGIVGDNEVRNAWFDEGLAEYSTLLYFESYPSEGVESSALITDATINLELYYDVMSSLNLKMNQSMELGVNEYSSEYEYVYMIYVKGLLFFNDLRKTLGDDVFFKGLQAIFKEYKFKNITKEEFISMFDKVSGLDLTEFVQNWLSGKVDISQN